MNRFVRSGAISATLVLALAGCEQGLGGREAGTTTAAAVPTVTRPGSRDVERPDIFQTTEKALWDGRPSLGGVWVAHPDVKEPERAILTNVSNGQSVPGALFRRERENPGPRIQLSSDAASALAILAGQPTEVSIMVVRPEEIEAAPEPLPIAEETPGETSPTDSATADDAAMAATAGAAATTGSTRKPNFLQRIFGRKQPPEPTVAVDPGLAPAADASVPGVETAPLDPVAATAAAAIDAAEAENAPVARPADGPAPQPAAAPAPAPSAIKNPYVQVGLFSVEANANTAAETLRREGILPSVGPKTSNGKTLWRVVVGPVSTADDQAALLAQIKRMGYKDAFLTAQ